MGEIRQARPEDLDAFYRIAIETGHLGKNARHLYTDPNMMGHIYSVPYLKFSPELAFVVEWRNRVVGLCVGTSDTRGFDAILESDWWPKLRSKYMKPNEKRRKNWTQDERRCQMIHVPEETPETVTSQFPAHLHMNLLPIIQGKGIGGLLLEKWMQRAMQLDVTAMHVGANAGNERAVMFWRKRGFKELPSPKSRTIWMGRLLHSL